MDFSIPSGSNKNINMTGMNLVTAAQSPRSKSLVIPELVRERKLLF